MTSPALETPFVIISGAMDDAGLLMEGQSPNSEDLAKYSRRLLQLINLWQTGGIKLWLNQDLSIPLVAGQGGQGNPYTLMLGGSVNISKPMKVLQGYYLLTSTGTRRPVTPLSWQEWLTLSTTTQQGQISQYFVDKQQLSLNVYTWLVPDSTCASQGTLHAQIQNQVGQFTNLTDTMSFPLEWALALEWGLADQISTGQPQAIVAKCEKNATLYKAALEDWDVEDTSTQLQVDPRTTQGFVGRFI